MSGRKTLADDRRRRKLITALWIFVIGAAVVFLIYRELTAILYILATLGVTALLLTVAVADLAHGDKMPSSSGTANDASNIAK